jgi:hypothetical protein
MSEGNYVVLQVNFASFFLVLSVTGPIWPPIYSDPRP